jgi:hypothetical protein
MAVQTSTTLKDLDGETAGRIAVEKCVARDNKRKLDPGKYTVILEPAAVSDLVGYLGFGFGARGAEQGQTFSARRAANRARRWWAKNSFPSTSRCVAIRSIQSSRRRHGHRRCCPTKKITWIEKGVVKNLAYDRFLGKQGWQTATPGPETCCWRVRITSSTT